MSEAADVERLKGAIQLGSETVRSLVLANGGAILALLSFYGNAIGSNARDHLPILSHIKDGLQFFAAGLLVAVFCSGVSYVGQLGSFGKWRFASHFLGAAMLLAVTSGVMFGLGIWATSQAFA